MFFHAQKVCPLRMEASLNIQNHFSAELPKGWKDKEQIQTPMIE